MQDLLVPSHPVSTMVSSMCKEKVWSETSFFMIATAASDLLANARSNVRDTECGETHPQFAKVCETLLFFWGGVGGWQAVLVIINILFNGTFGWWMAIAF